jgi:DNA-directed RNA polymerase alpha subunit
MLVSIDFEDGGLASESLTLRDFFAAMALQGLLANPELQNMHEKDPEDYAFWLEEFAWGKADAMIHTRSSTHKLFSYPLTELDLDIRSLNALLAEGITTIGELCKQHRFTIKRIPNLGKVSLEKIEAALAAHNLKLKGS